MEQKLIVSSSVKGQELLISLLKGQDVTTTMVAKSASEARRLLPLYKFDTIIILAPLMDEFGNELAIHMVEHSMASIILIVKQEIAEQVRERVEDFGVFVLETPLSKILFYQALKLIHVARKRITKLKKENIKLQNKIIDIRTVDRAKCVLIQYLNMSEEQAHRYIEKQAMDRQSTRKEVAESILKTYEN